VATARATIDELVVGDEPEAWRNAGFEVDQDGTSRIGTVRVRLAGHTVGRGLRAWSLRDVTEVMDADGVPDLDGIRTDVSDRPPAEGASHPNGATMIDHIVLMSPDGPRTSMALTAATGLDVRRVRDTGSDGLPMQQRFFRMGEVILELVSPSEPDQGTVRFFGLTFSASDLDYLAGFYGNRLGPIKDAVQPGRRIATLRHKELDLSVAVAFMSPEAPRP